MVLVRLLKKFLLEQIFKHEDFQQMEEKIRTLEIELAKANGSLTVLLHLIKHKNNG